MPCGVVVNTYVFDCYSEQAVIDPLSQSLHDFIPFTQDVSFIHDWALSVEDPMNLRQSDYFVEGLGNVMSLADLAEPGRPVSQTINFTQTASFVGVHDSCCPQSYFVDASDGDKVVYLWPAADMEGEEVEVKKIDINGSTTVTVEPWLDETIDGHDRIIIGLSEACLSIRSDGTQWWIV